MKQLELPGQNYRADNGSNQVGKKTTMMVGIRREVDKKIPNFTRTFKASTTNSHSVAKH
jgi:hypothetical protein